MDDAVKLFACAVIAFLPSMIASGTALAAGAGFGRAFGVAMLSWALGFLVAVPFAEKIVQEGE